MSDNSINEQMLLEGAWHALDQAGRLLRSASTLFDSGDSSTALAVAMFGREELGRCKLLMECAREVRAGSRMSVAEVVRRTEDHVNKQTAASLSVVLRIPQGTAVFRAATDALRTDLSEAERLSAHDTLRSAWKATAKRQPQSRHEDRCSALYVDLSDSGTEWRRPIQIARQYARDCIVDAVNDYGLQRERVAEEGIAMNLPPELGTRAMFEARKRMQTPVDPPGQFWPTTA